MKFARGSFLKRRFIIYRIQVFLILFAIMTTTFGAVALAFVQLLIHDLDAPPSSTLVISVLAGCATYFTLVCVFVSIFTNRFFGPIYRIHVAVKAILKGEAAEKITTRKEDYFKEIVRDFNQVIERSQSAPSRPTQSANENGFTLVELILIVAMLGILASMSIGAIQGWIKQANLSRDQATINEALNKARDLSRSRHECVIVEISEPLIKYESRLPNATSGLCALPLGAQTTSNSDLKIGLGTVVDDFSNGSKSIIFSPTGAVADNTVTTLKVSHGSYSGTFTIFPAIGLIRYR